MRRTYDPFLVSSHSPLRDSRNFPRTLYGLVIAFVLATYLLFPATFMHIPLPLSD